MKKILAGIIIILLFQGCTLKVEIPENHVGVITSDGEGKEEVLRPGKHLVDFDSEIILYDLNPEDFVIEFDFLFSDTTGGNIKLGLEFKPITDSLAAFYRKYQSTEVAPIIEQATGNITRDLLFKYRPTDLTKDEFKLEVVKTIKTSPEIVNYVEIRKVNIIELRF